MSATWSVARQSSGGAGRPDIEPLAVARELRNIEIRDFARRLALGARGLFDLVLAGVGVGGHVADVGDVHHVADIVAVELERAAQRIDEHVRAHVAQMLRQVDRRPARVEGHHRRVERLEFFDPAGEGVEDVKRLHVDCAWRAPSAPHAARPAFKADAPRRWRRARRGRACGCRRWLCIGGRQSMRNPEDTIDKPGCCADRPGGAEFR